MASWIDVCFLVIITLFFVGSIIGVLYVARAISSYVKSTKESLQQRGVTISREGVSVKTQRRFDRDDYLDATQRGFVKALGAATVGPESRQHTFLSNPNSTSNVVNSRAGNEHEKHMFGVAMRRSHGEGH